MGSLFRKSICPLILDKDKGIPVMYDIFPGSISDVSTLSGTLKKIKAHGIQDYVAVMDRGFFSLSNLRELMDNKISFIMAAKLQLNDLKQMMTEAQKDIDDVKYLHKFNKDPIFAKPITYNLDSNEVHGYVYYDPKLEQTEKQTLLSRLYDIREDLLKVRKKHFQVKRSEVEETLGRDVHTAGVNDDGANGFTFERWRLFAGEFGSQFLFGSFSGISGITYPYSSGFYEAKPWSRSIGGEFVDIASQIDFNISAFRSGIEVVSDKIESKILRVDERIVKA